MGNVYSQNGEDGIIRTIIDKLPSTDSWCCEFGAWDGKHLSNTFNLVENFDYMAVMIEGDNNKFKNLLSTSEQHKSIVPINRYVDVAGENSLDNILQSTQIPSDFDLLSIDVDGIDYLIWESCLLYRPKIVVIEINSSFKPDVLFNKGHLDYSRLKSKTGHADGGVNFRTCYELGRSKGYKLYKHIGNMIFIDEKYDSIYPELADDENYLKYFQMRCDALRIPE